MKKILIIFTLLLVVGCSKKEDIKLNIDCNGDKFTFNGNKGSFTCELINQEYTFSVNNKNNIIIIKTDKSGLSQEVNGGISLRGEYKEFALKKGKRIKLVTQTMDYNEDITIEWK